MGVSRAGAGVKGAALPYRCSFPSTYVAVRHTLPSGWYQVQVPVRFDLR